MKFYPRILVIWSVLAAFSGRAGAYESVEFLAPVPVPEAGRLACAVSSAGRLYALDSKKSVLLIFSGEDFKSVKSVTGSGKASLSSPQGLALASDGTVFVADTGNSRIQAFDLDGNSKGLFGSKGAGPGQLDHPEAIAVGRDGRVYVADTGNHRVQVFTQEGIFLFGFGSKGKEPGLFRDPTRIAVDPSDFIYVLDRGNERVQKFDPQTKFVKEFRVSGSDFAVDDYGFLYILDAKRGRIGELNPDGFVQGTFGTSGSEKGQFRKPLGLSASLDGLWIADTGNARLQHVRIANKDKVKPLPINLETKILVTGPTSTLEKTAAALSGWEGALYAYLPKSGRFVRVDDKGQEAVSFGSKSAKDASATKGSRGFAAREPFGVYVADSDGNRMQRFDISGQFRGEFATAKGLFASKKKEGRVKNPGGVAVTEKGVVYVADTGNRRIQAFNKDGEFLFGFGPQVGPYEFEEPSALAWDEEGFLYVLDRKLKKVFKCEPSGGFILAWGEPGTKIAQFEEPVSMVYDGRGYLYVLDKKNPRISVFDRKGKWVTNFFAHGTDERSLREPVALAVLGGQLAVSDPPQGRVISYRIHQHLAPPVSVSTQVIDGVVWLKWTAQEDSWVSQYWIYRSTAASGPYAKIAATGNLDYKDSDVVAYEHYYYRLASEGKGGDIGPTSYPAEVYVAGEFNRPPVEISSITVGNIFSANYKWYLTNPLGTAELANNVNAPFHDVKISFGLKDFMDFPTETVLDKLEPKQTAKIPLRATLNNRILEVTEDTPIQAEFTLTYYEKGKVQTISRALPLKVYSRNAITWDDPERIATFITPKDPPVLDLVRKVLRQKPEAEGADVLNRDLVTAIHVWDALGALGVKFLPSPNNPYEKVSQDPAFPVDYTQFPRETLRRKSGQCDDLATLTASMLEGATVRAALLDYPGHIALMFDTNSNDPLEIGLPEEDLISYDGTLWVPLEPTLLGVPFEESAHRALSAYRDMAKGGKARVIDPKQAWTAYAPATMPPSEEGLDAPEAGDVAQRFKAAVSVYRKERFAFLSSQLKELIARDGKAPELLNELGIVYVQHDKTEEASKQFEKALAVDPDNAAALNNLGNLAYMQGNYEGALARYQKASTLDPQDPGVWMNMIRASMRLGKKTEANQFARKAVALDDQLKSSVETLLK